MTDIFTKEQIRRLLANGKASNNSEEGIDHFPVVKLFTPDANFTWLLTELDPDCPENAFGLCDCGIGFPELGYVCLAELFSLRGNMGLSIERDLHFKAKHRLSTYAKMARKNEAIIA